MRYVFTHPARIAGQPASGIEFRRPKGGDLRAMMSKGPDGIARGDDEQVLVLIERCAGLTPGEFDDLDIEDVKNLIEIARGFFSSGPETGAGP